MAGGKGSVRCCAYAAVIASHALARTGRIEIGADQVGRTVVGFRCWWAKTVGSI